MTSRRLEASGIHPVPAFELGGHALDRALDAERLAAADAAERLLLLEHARRGRGGAEVELRLEGDHLLRAGRLAQPALHAGILLEAQHGALGIVARARRSGRPTRRRGTACSRRRRSPPLRTAPARAAPPRRRARAQPRAARAARTAARCALRPWAGSSPDAARTAIGVDGAQGCAQRLGIVGLDGRRSARRRSRARPGSAPPARSSASARRRRGAAARAAGTAPREAP